MFNLQFEQPYLSQAQAIMGRLCIKVDGADDPKTYNIMKSFLNAAKQDSKGATAIFNTDFGAEKVTQSVMPYYQSEQQTGFYATALLEPNKALMLTTKDGAVFCCALVRVGEQDYLSIMNPQTAIEIRDDMKRMVDHIKDTDKIKSLEQLTLWDKICDWFAQKLLDRRGEAVSRAEAYRNFYDGMKKHMDLLGKVEKAPATVRYKFNREYPEVDPNAPQNEEIQQNNQAVQQNTEVVQQPNEVQLNSVEEQPKPVEAQDVGEEQKVNEKPKVPGRRIQRFEVTVNAGAQKENPLEKSIYETVEIDLDALDEEIAREKEEQEKEQQRAYDEALQKRNAELKERADKVATIKAKIKKEEDFLNEWEPIYNQRQERIEELNKKMRDLNEYDMKHAGKSNRQRLVDAQTDLEGKIQKITEWMARMDEKKKFWDRKDAAEKRIETTREAYEKAQQELEPLATQLRYEEGNLQILSDIAKRDGAWMKPEEFLKNQYNQDKAQRDRKFAEEQKGRDEKITELENELKEYEKSAKNFSKKLSWFSKTDEEKDQKAVYEKYVKDTKEKLNLLKEENQQANKRHNEEDKAKQKELLSPSKELLATTTEKLKQAKTDWEAAFSKYNSYASQFDQAKAKVMDKQEAHQNALEDYEKNYRGKTVDFNAGKYSSVASEKLRLQHDLYQKQFEIKQFDANVETYDQEYGEILTELAPLSDKNSDLEIKVKAAKFRLEDFREELKEVDVDIAPLDMEDPRKASQQNKQNEKNEPQKQRGGLGMGGPMGH